MTISIDVVKQFVPIIIFSQYEEFFPCSIEYLLGGANCKLQVDGGPTINNPTQSDLYNYPQAANHVIIDPSQYKGTLATDPGGTPLYYAVQEFEDGVEIDYIFLYGYQGGQTFWVTAPEFDPVTWTYGVHQGDLERIAVRLVPAEGGGYRILQVCYERHGDETWFPANQVPMQDGRIVVHSAMYGHSSTNAAQQVTGNHKGCPVVDDGNYLALQAVSVLAPDNPPSGTIIWNPAGGPTPSPFVLIGLDANGEPVNDQLWAKYAGHLGQLQQNSLESANYWAGGNVSGAEWAYLKSINFFASPFLKSLTVGEGPTGPGSRYWIHPGSGMMAGNELLALWSGPDMGITDSALARFALDLTGSGTDVVLDFWRNSKSHVGATIFGPDGQSGLQTVWNSNDLGEGYGAIAWLAADLRGDGKQQALQLWKNKHLGVIVYGTDGQQGLTVLQSIGDTGQGWGAVNWSVADLRGDGTDQVVQFWNNGNLAAIVWGASGDQWFTDLDAGSGNLGEGTDAIAWLVADLRGDGKQEIIQLWKNSQKDVGAIVYGASGDQLFTKLSHQDDLGEGYGAIAWCVADINGDGRDEVIQFYENKGNAFAIVYGADGNNGLKVLWQGNPGQGYGAVAWQVGDLNGDGREEIVQLWNNDGTLGAIIYGGGPNDSLVVQSVNSDLYQGYGAVGWLSGNFSAPKVSEVVQFWDHDGSLGMITYGTAAGAGASVGARLSSTKAA